MTDVKEYISIKQLLVNEPYDLEISNIGIVKVKDPTEGDYIEANLNASKHPLWDKWDYTERDVEIKRQLALRMLIEPKISEEDYRNSTYHNMEIILDTIWIKYAGRLAKLNEERRKELQGFLEQMKVKG